MTVVMVKLHCQHVLLFALAAASACAYGAIAVSGQSLHEEGTGSHSLLTILGLFALCFAFYFAAIRVAMRLQSDRSSLWIIVGGALLFRGLLLFSDPIEEIDIYRYLWDGAVSTSGVNPFRYAPQQVLAADGGDALPHDLAKLVALRDASPPLAETLSRVHFGELPTVYPPVSQLAFAGATIMTPSMASIATRMVIMKGWFVFFDLLTIAVVLKLLRRCGYHRSLVVIYAWCPLVTKELANSGHLDSLAVFLTSLSAYHMAKSLFVFPEQLPAAAPGRVRPAEILWPALILGLAVGAKLYPVVLAPIFLASVAARRGWKVAVAAAMLFSATSTLVLYPMLPNGASAPWRPPASVDRTEADHPPLPPEETDVAPRDPSQSVRAFLSYWEMNDFIFLLVMENVRPMADVATDERAWFAVAPERYRTAVEEFISGVFSLHPGMVPFMFTRAVTIAVFLVLAGLFAIRAARGPSAEGFLRYVFLTIAWFWLLLPTGNPWYWTWAMPFLAFARSRVWYALAGLIMLYYLRFWLVFHYADTPVLGTVYRGSYFFDYVVTWLEFAPWFGALAWCSASARYGGDTLGAHHDVGLTS